MSPVLVNSLSVCLISFVRLRFVHSLDGDVGREGHARQGPRAMHETESTLAKLVQEGVRNIAVATPGFSADCLETLEEIALRAKEVFLSVGGENFAYLPCLNASAPAITLYQRLLGRELSGWINQAG